MFAKLLSSLHGFRRSEDGAFTALTLFMTLGILIATSFGIIIARHEQARAHMQQSIDLAVAAAASSVNEIDPELVALNYLETAGIDPDSVETFTETTSGLRTMTINASSTLDPLYSMFDHPLEFHGAASAADIVGDMEIVLVLEDSASMAGTKSQELIQSLLDFKGNVIWYRQGRNTSITTVPYSNTVNIGEPLFDALGIQRNVPGDSCVDFRDLDFTTTAMPGADANQQYWPASWGHLTEVNDRLSDEYACGDDTITAADDAVAPVIYFRDNSSQSNNQLRATLQSSGESHLDVGMKWGLALLSPVNRAVLQDNAVALNADGMTVNTPADFVSETGEQTTKIMVVLTDGEIDPLDLNRPSGGDPRQEAIDRFMAQCDLAKENGVLVFAIALTGGTLPDVEEMMLNCSSGPTFYQEAFVDPDRWWVGNLREAFYTIAFQLSRLQLTN